MFGFRAAKHFKDFLKYPCLKQCDAVALCGVASLVSLLLSTQCAKATKWLPLPRSFDHSWPQLLAKLECSRSSPRLTWYGWLSDYLHFLLVMPLWCLYTLNIFQEYMPFHSFLLHVFFHVLHFVSARLRNVLKFVMKALLHRVALMLLEGQVSSGFPRKEAKKRSCKDAKKDEVKDSFT